MNTVIASDSLPCLCRSIRRPSRFIYLGITHKEKDTVVIDLGSGMGTAV
jgi:hypothetical protein